MKKLALLLSLLASPALASGDVPFLSLFNTNFVVLIAFLIFVGVLLHVGVPGRLTGMLDARAAGIRKDLADAKALRDEAQDLLDSFARRRHEVQDMADRITSTARDEAQLAAEKAKADIARSVASRLKSAQDQIASAEATAIREVRDSAIQVAIAAAGDVITKGMSAAEATKLIDASIKQVQDKLH